MHFIREFIKSPSQTGSIAASSKHLAKAIVKHAKVHDAQTILEIGPGTGAFTETITRNKKNDADFVAVEFNKKFCNILQTKFPNIIIENDSVENISKILARHSMENVDAIVCSLPWAVFSSEYQDKLIQGIYDSMSPGAKFCTFAYIQGAFLPAGFRFKRKIDSIFSTVKKSRIVWLNIPPAFVYICEK